MFFTDHHHGCTQKILCGATIPWPPGPGPPDGPSNNLDLPHVEILKSAIPAYQGTLFVIS